MTLNTTLIVLGFTKFKDSSVVLHTLSRDLGRRSFLASVRNGTSTAHLQPLSILDADIIQNPKSDLWRARDFAVVHPLLSLRSNLYKSTMSLFMSEVLLKTIKEGCPEESFFDWCVKSILTLDSLETDYSNFHLRFLLELCGETGFAPSFEDIMPFAGEHFSDLRIFMGLPFGESMLMPLTGRRRNGMAEALINYLSHHIQSPVEIQSLKVLREIFA